MDELTRLSAAIKDTINRVVTCSASASERKRVIDDCVDYMQQRAAQCWVDPDEDLL